MGATKEVRTGKPHRPLGVSLLNQFGRLANALEMHPMAARMPQECVAVVTMRFMSEQLQVQFNVPSYQDWLDEAVCIISREY